MVQPSSTSPPDPQQTQQFLSSVLSQRGPASLPYTEDTKWLIRQHLLSLTFHYPSLQPKTATFTHNDGLSVNLLQTDGTIPMPFQGVTYNIPVVIWLIESYPRYPPGVYVNPTRDMIIKRPHPHVSPSGLVSIPYLQNWVYPSSNLVDLISNLSSAFSLDPPLYSQRRSNPNSNPNPPSYEHQQSGYPPSPYGRVQPPHTEDATVVHKMNAVNKLVEMVNGDIIKMRKERETGMEGLFSDQAVLRRREEEINKGLKEMQDEKEALELQLQVVLMSSDVLDRWIRDNEGKTKNIGKNIDYVDLDKVFYCADELSEQMLDCTAADLAIEDAFYSLDKAVQEGAVPFDQYLRNVRLLSREQFFHRATAAKVRAAQMQAQVASMAAQSPHSHYGAP
ncbi:Protein ELC [Hibiscus syriacus]|uniref:Protein ELC n=1 Tax=Hibiscus syriacus TaxID=106335 RepID=A0A6A2YUN1_HIBSY|nr:protein ELC-like [Hibiscus syriacus]KAE8683194.1 Protein ELC [Hibiscus syriacus]